MCLQAVKELDKPEAKGTGYKILLEEEEEEELHPQLMWGSHHYQKRKWYKAKHITIRLPINLRTKFQSYVSGFHIFTNLKDARTWKYKLCSGGIYKVEWKKQLAKGIQRLEDKGSVVVAAQMKILHKVKKT